jgi:hypothetical protein
VSGTIIARSLVIRRRNRRMGLYPPPLMPLRRGSALGSRSLHKLGEKPKMFAVYVGPEPELLSDKGKRVSIESDVEVHAPLHKEYSRCWEHILVRVSSLAMSSMASSSLMSPSLSSILIFANCMNSLFQRNAFYPIPVSPTKMQRTPLADSASSPFPVTTTRRCPPSTRPPPCQTPSQRSLCSRGRVATWRTARRCESLCLLRCRPPPTSVMSDGPSGRVFPSSKSASCMHS